MGVGRPKGCWEVCSWESNCKDDVGSAERCGFEAVSASSDSKEYGSVPDSSSAKRRAVDNPALSTRSIPRSGDIEGKNERWAIQFPKADFCLTDGDVGMPSGVCWVYPVTVAAFFFFDPSSQELRLLPPEDVFCHSGSVEPGAKLRKL